MSDNAVLEETNINYKGYPNWYRDLKVRIREEESRTEWPDARQEAWRRTDLKRINLEKLYSTDPAETDGGLSHTRSFQIPEPGNRNLRLAQLKDAIAGDYPGVRELIEAQAEAGDNRFILRLLAEAPQGSYLYLPRDYQPSDILFLEDRLNESGGCGCGNSCGCGKGETELSEAGLSETFTLNLVVLEEGAQAELWERIGSEQSMVSLHNRATLFLLKQGAQLKYYRTQTLPQESQLFDFSRALLKQGSEFYAYQAEKELNFNKSHLATELQEPRTHAELKGIYHIGENNFNEIFTEQIHQAPKCVSHSLYRGVLHGKARTVFNGMIKVSPEAVQTDAYLTNNNLLMNDGCRADSIPGLQINTNEVKCSHGSTTGKVSPRQMFYLTSRGFSEEQAKEILTQAFLEEVLDELPALVKREIENHWDLDWEA